MAPVSAPANARTSSSAGSRPVRLATAPASMSTLLLKLSSIRIRSAGTASISFVRCLILLTSTGPIWLNPIDITCRSAGRNGSSDGSWASSASSIGSYSSSSTTSSLVLKYRKNVLGEISAAAAIWSTVVCSYPCFSNSRNACSWMDQRVFCFLRSRKPGELMCRFFLGGRHRRTGRLPGRQEHRRRERAEQRHRRADQQHPVHRVQVRVLPADEHRQVTGLRRVRRRGRQRLPAGGRCLCRVHTGQHAAQDR